MELGLTLGLKVRPIFGNCVCCVFRGVIIKVGVKVIMISFVFFVRLEDRSHCYFTLFVK